MPDNYLSHILSFHTQFDADKIKIANADKIKNKNFDGIVICGMGASGNAGKIIENLRKELGLPQIILWSNYNLPEHNFKIPLYIFISFSGETAEVASGLGEFLKINANQNIGGIVISSVNSKLEDLAVKNGLPCASFEKNGMMPRESLGILYTATKKILSEIFNFGKAWKPEAVSDTFIKTAKDIAEAIQGKIPLVYTDQNNNALGHIWKTNLNETAKIFATTSVLPEIFHNEVQIFEKSSDKFAVIWIYNEETAVRNQKKLSGTHKILDEKGIVTFAFPIVSKNREEQIWHSVILANLVSYELAVLQGLDPAEISVISELKK